ncbi:MAG: hypothetical protein GTN78_00360 [Gemmatimonadales bacterium]|nr:hypothetical protein [Gemmatimonadales bacterium]NIQ98645.1 hypothetical protein [Gemmatimonadales bacterium]
MTADPYPALRLWRDELRAGKRARHTTDTLWMVACREAAAQEAQQCEQWDTWRHYMTEARRVLARAVQRREAAA